MQRAKDITEIIKNVAQILAIIVAGIWTYFLFGQKEAPSLEPRADVTGTLNWENSADGKSCRAIYKVVFQNTGITSFDVTKVHLQGWIFKSVSDSTKKITFLDIDEIQSKGLKVFDKVYEGKMKKEEINTTNLFVNHYTPESAYNHTFEWTVQKSGGDWICFKTDFYRDGQVMPEWTTASWDRVCPSKE